MNKTEITYIDNMILETVQYKQTVNDVKLASLLGCPRTLLLDRIKNLIEQGYVICDGDNFKLSEEGKLQWIPLDSSDPLQKMKIFEKSVQFDWQSLYIPPVGWQDK